MTRDIPTVQLNRYEIRRIRNGHPWVYAKSIASTPEHLQTGDVVQVEDPRGTLMGMAFYHETSKIKLRMISKRIESIDRDFFVKRMQEALDYRRSCYPNRSSFRLINSESDSMSGLIVDCYEGATLFQITSSGMELRKDSITEAVEQVLDPEILIERNDVANRKYEGLEQMLKVHKSSISETELESYKVDIAGTKYVLNLIKGNKTGLYLDQIDNHERFTALLSRYRDAKVLDCFSYVGGFSIAAAKTPFVQSVIGLDQGTECIEKAQLNAELSGVSDKCEWVKCNVFDWLREKSSQPDSEPSFDIIVLDPPSFTKNRHTVEGALRGYKELHIRALKLLKQGGLLFTYSCSHHISEDILRSLVFEAAVDTGSEVVEQESFSQALDHPIVPSIPETYYLKGFSYYKRS